MRKFEILREVEVSIDQLKEWLGQNPLPKTTDVHELGSWEDFHPEYMTHHNTLLEFLKLEPATLKIILNNNNAKGLLGETVGDLILRQDFKFKDPSFRQTHLAVLGGTIDVEKAFPKPNSFFCTIGKEFMIDYKTHHLNCNQHGRYRTPDMSYFQRKLVNSFLSTKIKILVLSLGFCDCGRVFVKYLLLKKKLNVGAKS